VGSPNPRAIGADRAASKATAAGLAASLRAVRAHKDSCLHSMPIGTESLDQPGEGHSVPPGRSARNRCGRSGRASLVGEGVASGSDGHDFNNNKSVRGHQGDVAEGVARPAKTGVAASGSALDHKTLDRLHSLRGPGERYSNVILRLAAEAERETRRRPKTVALAFVPVWALSLDPFADFFSDQLADRL
jgi:hypothetical protein